MKQKRVLFADNDSDYLETRSEHLELAGYAVFKARNPEEARKVLDTENIHLAVLDIRLVDDGDDQDYSGIILAKDEHYKSIPKIFVTGYPTSEAVREVYGSVLGKEPIAHAFLAKNEGPQKLIAAMEAVFEKVLGIKWDLQVNWDELGLLDFTNLARLLTSGAPAEALPGLGSELEDLFGRLFFSEEQVSVLRLNWRREAAACLSLFISRQDATRQAFAVIGEKGQILEEQKRLEEALQREDPPFSRPTCNQTLHYAGLVYPVADGGGGPLSTGPAFFERAGDRLVRTALEDLFERIMPFWYRHAPSAPGKADLAQLYRERLGLPCRPEELEGVLRRVQTLMKNAQAHALLKSFSLEANELKITFPNGASYRGPDPIASLFDPKVFKKCPTVITTTLGGIQTRSLLIDEDGRVHLTDLSTLSATPLLEDFIALECEFHFERLTSGNLLSLLDLEHQLCATRSLSEPLNGSVEPECRRSFTAIQSIRKLAADAAGEDLEPYLIGLFHHVMQGLLQIDPQRRLAKYQEVQLVQRLLLASMLLAQIEKLAAGRSAGSKTPGAPIGVHVVEASREVSVDGRDVRLTQIEFKLLLYLFKNAGRLCTREELLADVWKITGTPSEHDKGLVNTHIDRLRKKIDMNPGEHKYIQTQRGEGYRLVNRS